MYLSLAKRGVLTLVGEIRCYRHYVYYYHYFNCFRLNKKPASCSVQKAYVRVITSKSIFARLAFPFHLKLGTDRLARLAAPVVRSLVFRRG